MRLSKMAASMARPSPITAHTHDVAARQMKGGYGYLLSFMVKGDRARALEVLDAMGHEGVAGSVLYVNVGPSASSMPPAAGWQLGPDLSVGTPPAPAGVVCSSLEQ